jgi:hypothetical protein
MHIILHPLAVLYVEISEVFPICGNSVTYRYHHPSVHHGASYIFGIYVRNNCGMIVNPSNTLTLIKGVIVARMLIAICNKYILWH